MPKNKSFFQKFFTRNSSEVIEDYRTLKENMINAEFSLSGQKPVNQYAEVQVHTKR